MLYTPQIGHILLRNCLLKHVLEEKTEGGISQKVRQGRGCKQLQDKFKETRRYGKLKEETLAVTV